MQVLFEDTDRPSAFLYIDYLSVNVTVSPLNDLWFNLVNGSGTQATGGANFTRSSVLNVSALWNASGVNASYVWVNASGSVAEYAFAHVDENDNWTNATFDFVNYTLFPRAGNVSVRLKAYDSFYQQNYTSQQRSFLLWGSANVSGMSVNGSSYDVNVTIANGTYHTALCLATDEGSGASLAGYNVSFYSGGAYAGSALSNSSGWATFTFRDNSTVSGSYDFRCNITRQNGLYYNAGAGSQSNTTIHVVSDSDTPYFTDQWFEHLGQRVNQTNLRRNASIVIEAADGTTSVAYVTAEVNFTAAGASGYAKNWSMSSMGDGTWALEFNTSTAWLSLNQTGNVTVKFYIYDQVGNVNRTWDPAKNTLYVNSSLSVSMLNYEENTTYNRGENLSFYATDANGFLVEDVNWTANVTKYGQGVTAGSAAGEDYWNVTLNASEPPGNWTVYANASWMGNTGNASFAFNVTDALDAYFVSPSSGETYSADRDMYDIPLRFAVNYSRGGAAAWNVTVNLTCPDGDVFTLNRSGSYYILTQPSICTAPALPGQAFTLYANVTCPYNNTNVLEAISLSTAAEDTGDPDGGNNGGGGGGGIAPPACNCTPWVNGACGAGNCTDGQMRQTRTCTPSGCRAEYQCVDYPQCSLSENFNLTAVYPTVSVDQGGNATALFSVENTGNIPLSFTVEASLSCCTMSFGSSFELSEKESVDVPVHVHVPLSEPAGEKQLTVSFSAGGIGKNKTVKLMVEKSPALEDLETLRQRLADMEEVLSELEGTGIGLSRLKSQVSDARAALLEAEEMAREDNAAGLSSALSDADMAFYAASSEMLPARLLGFAWKAKMELAEAFVLLLMIVYLLGEVIMPPLTINRQLRRLERKRDELVRARKETEVKYFKRQIDEKTFNTMLADLQTKVHITNAEIEKKKEDAEATFRSKLSPGAVGRWLTGGPRRLARRLRGKKKDRLMEMQRQLAAASQGQGKAAG